MPFAVNKSAHTKSCAPRACPAVIASVGVQYSAAKLAALLNTNKHDAQHNTTTQHPQPTQPVQAHRVLPQYRGMPHEPHTNVPANNLPTSYGHSSTATYNTDVLTLQQRMNSPDVVHSTTSVKPPIIHNESTQYDHSLPSTAHVRRIPQAETAATPVSPAVRQSFRTGYTDAVTVSEKLRKQAELREALAAQIAEKQATKQQSSQDAAHTQGVVHQHTNQYHNSSAATPAPVSPQHTHQPKLVENRARQMSSTIFGSGTDILPSDSAAAQRAAAQAELRAQIDAQRREKEALRQKELEYERAENERIERDCIHIAQQYGQIYVSATHIDNIADDTNAHTQQNHDVAHTSHTQRAQSAATVTGPTHAYVETAVSQYNEPSAAQPMSRHQFTFHPTTYQHVDERPNTSLIKQQFEQYQQQLTEYDQQSPAHRTHQPYAAETYYNASYDVDGYQPAHHMEAASDMYTRLSAPQDDINHAAYQYAYDDVNSLTLQRSHQPVRARRHTLQAKKAKPIPPTAAEQRAIEIERRKQKGAQAIAASKKLSSAALQRGVHACQHTTAQQQHTQHRQPVRTQVQYPRPGSVARALHADSSFVPIDDAAYDSELYKDDLDHIIQQYSATHIRPATNMMQAR